MQKAELSKRDVSADVYCQCLSSTSKHQLAKIHSPSIILQAVQVPVSSVVTCLGVQFDSQITFTPMFRTLHVAVSTIFGSYGLWGGRWQHSAKTLVHALIAIRLDYCNSVLYQINTTATNTFQSVMHSAARFIMRKRKFDRITPTLRGDLHWLPVPERIREIQRDQALLDHLQVSPSNRTRVPPGAVCSCHS